MDYRVLKSDEMHLVEEPLRKLAAHHNALSRDFSGCFPIIPIEKHLRELAEMIDAGTARVEIMLKKNRVVGFGAVSFEDGYGEVDYLFVDESLRGMRHGERLLENMLTFFRENNVTFVDIKVVRGNRAKRFYERHGFLPRTDILSMRLPPAAPEQENA